MSDTEKTDDTEKRVDDDDSVVVSKEATTLPTLTEADKAIACVLTKLGVTLAESQQAAVRIALASKVVGHHGRARSG